MERDPQAQHLQDELDLAGTEHPATTDSEDAATGIDCGDHDADYADDEQEMETAEACDDVEDDDLKATKLEEEKQANPNELTALDDGDAQQMPRWMQVLPCSTQLQRALLNVRRLVRQPLGVLAVVGGVLVLGVGLYPTNEPKQPTPLPAVTSAVFPSTDFRSADRGSITDSQAGAVLAHHAHTEDRAATATARQDTHQGTFKASNNNPDATALRVASKSPAGNVAHQTDKTNRRRPTRRGTRIRAARDMPHTVSPGENAEAQSEPIPAYFIATGDDDDDEPEEKTEEQLQLVVGTRIEVALDLGISSARHGTVVARTTERIVDAAGVVIPKGTVVTGRSSSGHQRIYVDVTGIRLGTQQYRAQGVATRGDELGIAAERVETSFDERTSARVADGALGALKGLAIAAAGTAGQVLSQTAGGALEEAQREQRIDRTVTLTVPAGTVFTVVITG